MANEAVIIAQNPNANPISFTVNDNAAYEKGTLLWLSGARSISGASTTGAPFAGITAAEKEADDGATTVGLWVPGQNNIFDLHAVTAVTAGEAVMISGQNMVRSLIDVTTAISGGYIVGKALEEATAGEVINVLV